MNWDHFKDPHICLLGNVVAYLFVTQEMEGLNLFFGIIHILVTEFNANSMKTFSENSNV